MSTTYKISEGRIGNPAGSYAPQEMTAAEFAILKVAVLAGTRTIPLGCQFLTDTTFEIWNGTAFSPIGGGPPITVTGSRSLADSDDGKVLNVTSASPVTLTIPAGLRAGFICAVVQSGAGQVTFSASGTTLNNVASQSSTSAQYAVVMVTQVSTNSFVLSGSTGA